MVREHGQFPFGGILVRSSGAGHPHIVAVDRLAEEESSTWTPPPPPVVRTSRDLADRYVLTEVGGVAVQTGLDRGGPTGQTDDLTVLSKEPFEVRWREFDATVPSIPLLRNAPFPGLNSDAGWRPGS